MSAAPALLHPLLSESNPNPNSVSILDALNNSSSVLWMLADLFTAKAGDHCVLDNDSARNGIFIQLTSIANTLDVISAALSRAE